MAFGKKPAGKDAGPKTATTAQGGVVHYANGRKVEKVKTTGPINDETGKPNARWGTADAGAPTTPPTQHAKATGSAAPNPDNTPPKAKTPEEAHAEMDNEATAAAGATKAVTPPKKGTAGKFPSNAAPPASKNGAPPVPPSKKGAPPAKGKKPSPFAKK